MLGKQRLLVLCATLCIAHGKNRTLRWVDHFDIGDKDIFFDRVVAVFYDPETTVRAAGLLLTRSIVLTTYNPFRNFLLQGKANMKNVKVVSIKSRLILNGTKVSYDVETSRISCGRQVIPLESGSNVWHLKDGEQSPLHDLMVLRLANPLKPRPRNESNSYEFNLESDQPSDAGPIVSLPASRYSRLGDDIKIASYGHVDHQHIFRGTVLRSEEFEYDEHVQTDCEEWLPRGWGHFICLNNVRNFPAIASGAVLVHKDFFYGLGCFYLEKGQNKSILVFTDLRPYLSLIYNSCSEDEKNIK